MTSFVRVSSIAVLLLLALSMPGCSSGKGQARTGKAITGDLLQQVTIAGNVVPVRRTVIYAPYPGYISRIFVKTGDHVKAGAPLVSVSQSLHSGEAPFPIRAPFSGTVVQLEKAEGEYVRDGGDQRAAILRLDDLSKLFIEAKAAELDRNKLKAGQEAVIKASAVLDRNFKGVVRELSLAAVEQDNWRNRSQIEFPVRVEILDPDSRIRPGMSALIDIVAEKKPNVLLLRHEFIHREREQYFVLFPDGTRRDIRVGLQNEEAFEVIEGLKSGDQVQQVDFARLVEQL